MFGSIYLYAAMAAQEYRHQLEDEARLRAMPEELFQREMRIREVKALERQARKNESVIVHNHNSIFS